MCDALVVSRLALVLAVVDDASAADGDPSDRADRVGSGQRAAGGVGGGLVGLVVIGRWTWRQKWMEDD